jgi:hypothetical protein
MPPLNPVDLAYGLGLLAGVSLSLVVWIGTRGRDRARPARPRRLQCPRCRAVPLATRLGPGSTCPACGRRLDPRQHALTDAD